MASWVFYGEAGVCVYVGVFYEVQVKLSSAAEDDLELLLLSPE